MRHRTGKKQPIMKWSPRIPIDRLVDQDNNSIFKKDFINVGSSLDVSVDEFTMHPAEGRYYNNQPATTTPQHLFASNASDLKPKIKPKSKNVAKGKQLNEPAPEYYRFKSVAVQHFINMMNLSGKRSRCAYLALKILSYRYSKTVT